MTAAPDSKTPDTGAPDSDGAPAGAPAVGRPVLWTGLALGTAVAVLAMLNGIRIPGLEVVLSVLATWVLLMVLAVTVAELLRRHHRALARHAARHGKRGALLAARHSRRGSQSAARSRLPRAEGGGPVAEPRAPAAHVHPPRRPGAADAGGHRGPGARGRHHTGPAPVVRHRPWCRIAPTRRENHHGRHHHQRRPGQRSGRSAAESRQAWRPAAARRPYSAGAPRLAHRGPAGGSVPAEWAGVIARAADFEPGDDGELLGWMGDEVSGVAGYAEALIELYESCTAGIGLDPVAMTALHDVADAAAHAAETMSGARRRFAGHYELPREFAGNGGLMPHDGRWVTGDGDA